MLYCAEWLKIVYCKYYVRDRLCSDLMHLHSHQYLMLILWIDEGRLKSNGVRCGSPPVCFPCRPVGLSAVGRFSFEHYDGTSLYSGFVKIVVSPFLICVSDLKRKAFSWVFALFRKVMLCILNNTLMYVRLLNLTCLCCHSITFADKRSY